MTGTASSEEGPQDGARALLAEPQRPEPPRPARHTVAHGGGTGRHEVLLCDVPAYLAGQAEHCFAELLVVVRALQHVDRLLARDVMGRWADTLDALAER